MKKIIVILLLISCKAFSQQANPDTLATSAFLYYDGASFSCIDNNATTLNNILAAINTELCKLQDTATYYQSNDIFATIDTLESNIDTFQRQVIKTVVTSLDTSIIISLSDNIYTLSLNQEKFETEIIGDLINCNSVQSYCSDTAQRIFPFFSLKTSTSPDSISFELTPYLKGVLTTSDCSLIEYNYIISDTNMVAIQNGTGKWNGGKAFGATKEFRVAADMNTPKLANIAMVVYRANCNTYLEYQPEYYTTNLYSINNYTVNCGWGTNGGTWNTLSGKWCSE